MKKIITAAALALLTAALLTGPLGSTEASAQDKMKKGSAPASAVQDDAAVIAAQRPSYPLQTCVVSGEPFGGDMGDPIDLVVDGRYAKLCCKGCIKSLQKSPEKYFAMIDAAVIAAQKPSYPLDKCVVSGEAFGGDMGDPIDMVHGTRYVKLCCKGCVKGFKRNSQKFMTKLDAALIEAQLASYPLDTCVISGEPLESKAAPTDFLHGTRLVRVCCNDCKPAFLKSPGRYLAKLDAAAKKKPGATREAKGSPAGTR